MLKITEQQDAESGALSLILEGRLSGPWVEDLNAYCHKMSEDQKPCKVKVIDLTGVTFIDAVGKTLLASLWRQGAELRATGCLTRCVVEEITTVGRFDASSENDDKFAS
ncbi:MAG: hypothetical protein AB7L09_08365 [Nitrospira sp.]